MIRPDHKTDNGAASKLVIPKASLSSFLAYPERHIKKKKNGKVLFVTRED